jgi:hypothetical protein
MPPSSPVENILGNRAKAVASRNHALPLVLREQETPKPDPVNHSVDNLQEISRVLSIKNNIISAIPN